jgi:hypothetical protein
MINLFRFYFILGFVSLFYSQVAISETLNQSHASRLIILLTSEAGANSTPATNPYQPESVVLPGGKILQLPKLPGAEKTYNCDLNTVLCVPAEYATIQLAANAVSPGDTVFVTAGNYGNFQVTTTGEKQAPILFVAQPGVVIDSFTSSEHGIVVRSNFSQNYYVDYVHIVGFKANAPPGRCIYFTKAIASRPMVGHVVARNICINAGREGFVISQVSESLVEYNIIINAGNGSPESARDHGIYLSNGGTGDSLIRANIISGSSTAGIHFNGDRFVNTGGTDGIISGLILDSNILIGNGQNGFNLDGVQDSLFINNILYKNTRHGIRAYAIDGSEGPKNMVVINNTFIENSSAVKFSGSMGGHIVFNNLFVNQRAEEVVVPAEHLSIANNVNNNGIEFKNLTSLNFKTLTPVQTSLFDFHVINSDNPLINNIGLSEFESISAPIIDQTGTDRVANPDAGALETN